MFSIVDKTVKILRDNNICDRFDYIFEEKENRHLHVWILPRYKWMNEIVDHIIYNVGIIFDYAKKNFRNDENHEKIKSITEIVKNGFKE